MLRFFLLFLKTNQIIIQTEILDWFVSGGFIMLCRNVSRNFGELLLAVNARFEIMSTPLAGLIIIIIIIIFLCPFFLMALLIVTS